MGNQDSVKSSLIFRDYVVNYVEFKLNKEFKKEPIKINFNISKKVEFDDEQDEMKRIKDHFNHMDEDEFEEKLIEHNTYYL